MDAFQPYFDYIFTIICGIPSVILEGTVADWELLESKVQALHRCDLDLSWWTKHLLPLCAHFGRAARGDVDLGHWKDLCKIMARYGADDLNGWLLKFIPYVRKDKNERPVHKNPVMELTSYDDKTDDSAQARYQSRFKITGCTSNMLPSGVSSVPVICKNLQSGSERQIQFVAGLTGVEQSTEDLSLRPLVSWAISEPTLIDVLIQRLQREKGCTAPKPIEKDRLIDLFHGHLPGDMWRFYTEIDGVKFTFREPNRWGETACRIAVLDSFKPLWDHESVEKELRYLSSQHEISPDLFEQRRRFSFTYSQLIRIAQADHRRKSVYYVFGRGEHDKVGIYRWTDEASPDAFTRVAESFTEWLASLIDA